MLFLTITKAIKSHTISTVRAMPCNCYLSGGRSRKLCNRCTELAELTGEKKDK